MPLSYDKRFAFINGWGRIGNAGWGLTVLNLWVHPNFVGLMILNFGIEYHRKHAMRKVWLEASSQKPGATA